MQDFRRVGNLSSPQASKRKASHGTTYEVVAMDLKVIENKLILHLIDHVTRFSAAVVVKSKKEEEIIQYLFTMG